MRSSITDKHVIPNKFNDFFISIGLKLANKKNVNTTYKNYLKNLSMHAFQFKSVDEETVFKTIDMLQPKLSCSIDDISVKLLKTIKAEIYKPITLIINQMLATGIFPDKLTLAKVIPLHKKDDNTILNNYRPISILPDI